MSQLPYINETHKQEHESEINAKRSLMIGYDSENLQYNKLGVNADGSLKDPLPTLGQNPSYLISYNAAGEAVYIDTIIGSDTYRQTFTRSDMVITSTLPISENVKL